MNMYVKLVIAFVVAYMLGNISPAIILGNINGVDIRKEGSGNAGTTNVLRVLGPGPAVLTLIGDMLKAIIAVRIGFSLGGNMGAIGGMLAFAGVILGHVFPVIYKFKGGKGVASGIGGAFALDWLSASATVIIFALGLGSTKKMSVGSMLAAIAYPFLIWFYAKEYLPVAIPAALFIVINHIPNIKRLLKGTEPDVDFKGMKLGEKLGKVFYDPSQKASEEADFIDTVENAEDVEDAPETVEEPAEETSDEANSEESTAGEAAEEALEVPENIEAVSDDADEKDETEAAEAEVTRELEELDNHDIYDYFRDVEIPALSDEERKKIAVIGNGSFGTAMANLAAHNGHEVTLYGRNSDAMEEIKNHLENFKYLPGAKLSGDIEYTSNLKNAVSGKDIVIFAIPAQQFRKVAKAASRNLSKKTIIVNLAKGIEQHSLLRMSEIAGKVLHSKKYVVLSGPSHAEELVRNYPASVVVASTNQYAACTVQKALGNDKFRVYTDSDVTGVEIAGALKNVYAIATGICDGMAYGVNAKAALMTRAIHELSKLGLKLGADKATFAGLSGIGDLMVTCDSDLSRNRRFGRLIGEGKTPEEAIESIGSVVEGFYTTTAAKELAEKNEVECPIIDATAAILSGQLSPDEALRELMTREQKEEKE